MGAMRILVVEDEHKIANSIKKGLEQERYAVDVAYTGTDGFDLASVESYDLIILDLMLPGMDGLTLCRRLREQSNHTPVLVLTAKSQVDDKVSGLNSGADDYLTKPFSFEELLARIRALLRRPREALDSKLTVKNLSMDTESYQVLRGNTAINLSNKEFTLLEYLMRNPNKILKKETIISHVWDYSADILPNTVEVYIKNLRDKIDVPFPNETPLICTVRGFGYLIGEKNAGF
jgi:two-component system, OmpR family, response regulator